VDVLSGKRELRAKLNAVNPVLINSDRGERPGLGSADREGRVGASGSLANSGSSALQAVMTCVTPSIHVSLVVLAWR
jgi:hypothetical protein